MVQGLLAAEYSRQSTWGEKHAVDNSAGARSSLHSQPVEVLVTARACFVTMRKACGFNEHNYVGTRRWAVVDTPPRQRIKLCVAPGEAHTLSLERTRNTYEMEGVRFFFFTMVEVSLSLRVVHSVEGKGEDSLVLISADPNLKS